MIVNLGVMKVPFAKMHGIGNDIIVVDDRLGALCLTPEQIRTIADRRMGVGCDQFLVAAPPETEVADVGLLIFNADGSEAEQCGNGVRCFARYLRDNDIVPSDWITIETVAGLLRARIAGDGEVSVDMGPPRLEPEDIPLVADRRCLAYSLRLDDLELSVGAVSMGNPHAVMLVEDVQSAAVGSLGPRIQASERFPAGVNVGFMEVLSPQHIRLRVYERGVGETLACGSGACAAVVVGHDQGLLNCGVDVDLPGGTLRVEWKGHGESVWLTGAATHVFDGEIEV